MESFESRGMGLLQSLKKGNQSGPEAGYLHMRLLSFFGSADRQGIVGNFGPEPLSARHVTTKIGRCDEVSKDGRGE